MMAALSSGRTMVAIPDRNYNAACGKLASRLGVSLASAAVRWMCGPPGKASATRRARIALAENHARGGDRQRPEQRGLLSALLGAVSSEENFLDED